MMMKSLILCLSVMAAVQAYQYCQRTARGCAGHDIATLSLNSKSDCEAKCSNNNNCLSISYYERSVRPSGTNCYIKNYQCPALELRETNGADLIKVDDSLVCSEEINKLTYSYCPRMKKGCQGHDINTSVQTSLEKCQARCNDDPKCLTISYYTDREGTGKTNCYLKDYRCQLSELRDTTGGDYTKVNNGDNCDEVMKGLSN